MSFRASVRPEQFLLTGLTQRSNWLCAGLIGLTCTLFGTLSAAVLWLVPTCSRFGHIENQACGACAAMQLSSLLHMLFVKQTVVPSRAFETRWVHRIVFVVKFLSMITNVCLFAFPTPSIIDAVSGRQFVMLRWVEWVTLSFVMTFVVEAIDSTSLRGPALCAISQLLSTSCGMLMPLAPSLFWWKVVFAVSCMLFTYLFRRLWLKEARPHAAVPILYCNHV